MYRLIPVVISLLILGAHFLRAGQPALTAVCLASILLLAIRRSWVMMVIQAILFIAVGIWFSVTYQIWMMRTLAGEPRLRMALILGGVAIFTGASTLVFGSEKVRSWYERS